MLSGQDAKSPNKDTPTLKTSTLNPKPGKPGMGALMPAPVDIIKPSLQDFENLNSKPPP